MNHYLSKLASEKLTELFEFEVEIQQLSYNIFTRTAHIKGFESRDFKGNPILDFPRLDVKLSSYNFKTISIENIVVYNPIFQITVPEGDSMSAFKRMLDKFKPKPGQKKKPVPVFFKRFEVVNGTFAYHQKNVERRPGNAIDFKHIAFNRCDAVGANMLIDEGKVWGEAKKIRLHEKGGFVVEDCQSYYYIAPDTMRFTNSRIRTPLSRINMDLTFATDNYLDYQDFLNKVDMSGYLKRSEVDFEDIAHFAHGLEGMKKKIFVKNAKVKGTVADLNVSQFEATLNQSSVIRWDVCLKGLPDIRKTYAEVNFRDFNVRKKDVADLILPGNKPLAIPEMFSALDFVRVEGEIDGFLNKFNVDLDVSTNWGEIFVNVRAKDTLDQEKYFTGMLNTLNFDLGSLIKVDALKGNLTSILDISALGRDFKTMNYFVNGKINSICLNKNEVTGISLDCEAGMNFLHGRVVCKDDDLDFDFDGLLDFQRERPLTSCHLNVNYVDLKAFDLWKNDSVLDLSARVDTRIEGREIDQILGNFVIQDFRLQKDDNEIFLKEIKASTDRLDSVNKHTVLRSDWLDLDLTGAYSLQEIPRVIKYAVGTQVPALRTDSLYCPPIQNFDLEVQTKTLNDVLKAFVPNLELSNEVNASLKYESQINRIDLWVDFDYMMLNRIAYTGGSIWATTEDSSLYIGTSSDRLFVDDSTYFNDFSLEFVFSQRDSIPWRFSWSNYDSLRPKSYGDFRGSFIFREKDALEVKVFQTTKLMFFEKNWTFFDGAGFKISKDNLEVRDLGIIGERGESFIHIDGKLNADTNSLLKMYFHNFDLSYMNYLTRRAGFEVDAKVSGKMDVTRPDSNLSFTADVVIPSLKINRHDYGALHLNAYNKKVTKFPLQSVSDLVWLQLKVGEDSVNALPPRLLVEGSWEPKYKDLNLEATMNEFPAVIIEGFLKSFASHLDGKFNGKAKLRNHRGTDYQLEGQVQAKDLSFKVDLLNTYYKFPTAVMDLDSRQLLFSDFKFVDLEGNRGQLRGKIKHDFFTDMSISSVVDFSNVKVLNTVLSYQDAYAGTIYASGNMRLEGPFENLNMLVNAQVKQSSHIDFNLTSATSAVSSNFVQFAKKDTVVKSRKFNYYEHKRKMKESVGNLDLLMNLEVNRNLLVGLNMDNFSFGADMSARGSGSLTMGIQKGNLTLQGDYILEDGKINVSMVDIINKRFKIRNGSSVSWNGNLLDAQLNIDAIYTTRASLYPILSTAAWGNASEFSKGKVGVESIIMLKGNLMNPSISFDMNLLNVEEDSKEIFFSQVNKENEDEMLKQTFSLLLFNSFMAIGNNEAENLGENALVSSSELLFNQLNGFLSRFTKDINVEINYTPETTSAESEVQLMMSGEFFNNRLIVEGNIGVNPTKNNAQKASNVVGEVNVEWKIREDLRLRAYNKSNEQDLINHESAYTQGVGVVYRRDFNSIKESLAEDKRMQEERKKQRIIQRERRAELKQENRRKREQMREQKRSDKNKEQPSSFGKDL